MPIARTLFVCLVVLSSFSPGCGDDKMRKCAGEITQGGWAVRDSAKCEEGEECLYYGNKFDSWYCFLPCCKEGSVCPDGLSCENGPSSCPTCMDSIKVCL